MIRQFLLLILELLIADGNQPTYDLRKRQTVSERIDAWAYRHAPLLLAILMVLLVFMFVFLCFALFGTGSMESTVQYNGFERVI